MSLASVQKKPRGYCVLTWMTFGVIAPIRSNMMAISKYEIFNTIDTVQLNGTDELDEKFSD